MSCQNCSPYFNDKTPAPASCCGTTHKCHEVVDTVEEVSQFRNAFVTVREESAVYHVDEVGNVLAVSRNPIFNNDYQPESGDFKQTIVFNFDANEGYVFDPLGNYLILPLLNPEPGESV